MTNTLNPQDHTQQNYAPAPTDTVLVIGGSGGAGTSTLVKHLRSTGVKAYELSCMCKTEELLVRNTPDVPKVKLLVVDSSYHGASRAAELTAKYDIQVIAVVKTSPHSIPFSAKVKFRALTGRADVIVMPNVWKWRKGNTKMMSKAYKKSYNGLLARLGHHIGAVNR